MSGHDNPTSVSHKINSFARIDILKNTRGRLLFTLCPHTIPLPPTTQIFHEIPDFGNGLQSEPVSVTSRYDLGGGQRFVLSEKQTFAVGRRLVFFTLVLPETQATSF